MSWDARRRRERKMEIERQREGGEDGGPPSIWPTRAGLFFCVAVSTSKENRHDTTRASSVRIAHNSGK
jgi:hypothetical protein